jgi:anthranilate phosphoribosyltransferase
MDQIIAGQVSTPLIAALLAALKVKGETTSELLGFAQSLRAQMQPVRVETGGRPLLDTCGTGGDLAGTFNISTVTAFVVAACGLPVAKHGNRSVSSRCGSADVLEGLGVRVDLTPPQMARCVEDAGIGFLFAPLLHPALQHAAAARQELKMRTVFNLLGPLVNPAGATVQLVGASEPELAKKLAETLSRLGLQRGLAVCGADGLDEITTTTRTFLYRLLNGVLFESQVTPADFGVPESKPEDLLGGGLDENVRIARDLLQGRENGPKRDIVLVNAAAALVAAGVARHWREGVDLAETALSNGGAAHRLQRLIEVSNS